ncbi:recombinase family protein [Aeromonas salmonicida]|uniref:recombinase family protein n=1 Tax=Aeromonas salmonicida TaxID=645 RepID=UPI00259F143E|nr:recombinase family protein [Aeromonas salmonicida]MDM5128665.1 recombinase family protein [Aeromonas salmonicida]
MIQEQESSIKSTAYSYIRLSSKQQILGDGQRRQMEAAIEYCQKNNLTLSSKSFRDLGVSAFKEVDRPSLSDLHQCIANGSIKTGDVIILEKLDRLSRQGIAKTQAMLQDILSQGVVVVSLMDGLKLDKNSLNDLTLVIRIAIAADLAHKESSAKSARIQEVKNSIKEKIKAGIPVPLMLPFWLKFKDDKFVFDERVSVLKTILEKKKQGDSLEKIAGYLNSSNVPPIKVNGEWTPSTLSGVIKSKVLFGAHQLTVMVNGKYQPTELVQNYYPAVISYSEYLELNSKAVQRPAGASETNHISGIVYCGVCGSKMANKSRNNKNNRVTYTYCRKSLINKCEHTGHLRDLHKFVISNIHHLELKQVSKQDNGEDKIRIELDQVEKRVADLTSQLSITTSPLVTTAILTALSHQEQQKNDLMAELKSIVTIAPDAIQTLLSFADDPKKFNIELKKIIKRIEVKPYGKHHLIKVERYDNHHITWRTGGWIKGVSDSEKSLKMVEALLEGAEEE